MSYQCICHNFQGDHEDQCIEHNSRKIREYPAYNSQDYETEVTGRCHRCKIRFIWPKSTKIRLKDACCPDCGSPLRLTTHLWKGRTDRRIPARIEARLSGVPTLPSSVTDSSSLRAWAGRR